MPSEFIEANRANWDEKVAVHVVAYQAEELADDPGAISGVARADADILVPFLPDASVAGLDVLHLQCHIGTDTLSWARMGANVTGTDFSGEAIAAATRLAERAGVDVDYVQTSNEDAPAVLGKQFDVVLTTIGVLWWLPDLTSWAEAIRDLLRPGATFFVRDMHPMLGAIDYRRNDDLLVVTDPYFETGEAIRDDTGADYASDYIAANATSYGWTHSLGEILTAVLDAGLVIEHFGEQAVMPWKALPSLVETPEGWALPDGRERLPLLFWLTARRPE